MRLALLVCGTLPVSDYPTAFTTLFAHSHTRDAFVLDSYDVVHLRYPADDQLDSYDAIVITGSGADAYADIEWINSLVTYTANVANTRPSIKIFGFCFGHQIVARAMGEQVVPNNGRWEISPTLVTLTDMGKRLFGVDSFYIQQMHQDHVPTLPASFHKLGSTPVSHNQGMVRFYGESVSLNDIHILTLQGHPEFTEPIMTAIINKRTALGIFDKETAAEGLARSLWPNDGVGVVGRTVWAILGIQVL